MPHCKFTNLRYTDSDEDKMYHQRLLAEAARGALPLYVREAMKDAGWAVVENGNLERRDIEASKIMICYAYWARAKERGIPEECFEEFMLDRLYFIEHKRVDWNAAQAQIAKWDKYEG